MTTTATANVYQRLRDVRLELSGFAKNGTAPEGAGSYAYIRYDDVAGQVGSLMAQHGLVVVPRLGAPETEEVGTSHSGNAIFRTRVQLHLRVVNVDDPNDYTEAEWYGESNDTGDKGVQKAASSATKFCMMKLLQLAGAEDTEADPPREAAGTQKKAAPSYPTAPLCKECERMGLRAKNGTPAKVYPPKDARYAATCNGVDAQGKYQNHKPGAAPAATPVPSPAREYMEGDACPFPHDPANYPAKFKVASGGPHKGLLQCTGKVNGQWADHLAPPPTFNNPDPIPFE